LPGVPPAQNQSEVKLKTPASTFEAGEQVVFIFMHGVRVCLF